MVLIARDSGIRSPSLRRWVRRQFGGVGEAPTLFRKLRRLGVTALGVAWGTAAMLASALGADRAGARRRGRSRIAGSPLAVNGASGGATVITMPPSDFAARAVRHVRWRARRVRTVTTDAFRRGDRSIVMTPPAGLRFGNWLYLWLDAHARTRLGDPTLVLEAPGMSEWLAAFPRLRDLTIARDELRFHDRREWDDFSWRQRFGVDFARDELDAFIGDVLLPHVRPDTTGTLVINVRRGDYYARPELEQRYGFEQIGYVRAALDEFDAVDRALVISDDVNWCRENLEPIIRRTAAGVEYAEPGAVANFLAVAGASRIIGTNSTFTYWAAYVAGVVHEDVRVVMPLFMLGCRPEPTHTSSILGGRRSAASTRALGRSGPGQPRSPSSTRRAKSWFVERTSSNVPLASTRPSFMKTINPLAHGGQAVRDDHDRQVAAQLIEGLGDLVLGDVVERRRGLIEDERRRATVERSSEAQALPLASRESHAALSDDRVETIGQLGDQRGELGHLDHLGDAIAVDRLRRDAERDVGGQGVVHEEHVLRHDAESGVPRGAIVEDRPAPALDRARRGFEQPEQEVEQSALARPARADERCRLVSRDDERHVVEHELIGIGVVAPTKPPPR